MCTFVSSQPCWAKQGKVISAYPSSPSLVKKQERVGLLILRSIAAITAAHFTIYHLLNFPCTKVHICERSELLFRARWRLLQGDGRREDRKAQFMAIYEKQWKWEIPYKCHLRYPTMQFPPLCPLFYGLQHRFYTALFPEETLRREL